MMEKRSLKSLDNSANSSLNSLKRRFFISAALTLLSGLMLYFLSTASAADLDITAFTVKTNPDGTSDY